MSSSASSASCSSSCLSRRLFWWETPTPSRTSWSWPSRVTCSVCWRGTTVRCSRSTYCARCTSRGEAGEKLVGAEIEVFGAGGFDQDHVTGRQQVVYGVGGGALVTGGGDRDAVGLGGLGED